MLFVCSTKFSAEHLLHAVGCTGVLRFHARSLMTNKIVQTRGDTELFRQLFAGFSTMKIVLRTITSHLQSEKGGYKSSSGRKCFFDDNDVQEVATAAPADAGNEEIDSGFTKLAR